VLNVNGRDHTLDIEADTPLLYALRDDLNLNGAKYGCGLGQCGACTVMIDGKAAYSCLTSVAAAQGHKVVTIESLGDAGHLSALQQAFIDEQAAQCGYCSAGMIMRAAALLAVEPHPDDARIREHMQTNLCRCGTHMRILRAVARASKAVAKTPAKSKVKA
jgi:aerobic-type carbon monoxide dehydrogenase small subunit (CoxS/CutS family)